MFYQVKVTQLPNFAVCWDKRGVLVSCFQQEAFLLPGMRPQQEAGTASLPATFTKIPSFVGPELGGEIHLLYFKTISSASGRSHMIQQMYFGKERSIMAVVLM